MNEYKEAIGLYDIPFLEAVQIIDDSLANGFTFKWENNKLYFTETTKKPQNILEILTKSC